MATIDLPAVKQSRPTAFDYPKASPGFHWAVALLAAVTMAGLYLDGWAHNTMPDLIETFFTPYHALLYGGYGLVASLLATTHVRNLAAGHAWSHALPRGYGPALVGVLLFAAGGVGDLVWHELFGFEDDVEALLSPTHLLLATGAFLYISAPLRAGWLQPDGDPQQGPVPWRRFGPVLLSMLLILSQLTFFTQYATYVRPETLVERPWGEELVFLRSVHGIFQLLMPTALVSGCILFLMQRWRLPTGSLFLLIGVNYALMFGMTIDDAAAAPLSLPAALLAGVAADLLYRRLRPGPGRREAVRVFAFLVPLLMTGFHIIVLLVSQGLWWPVHMWAGAPFVAGVAGLLLSFLAFPPPQPGPSQGQG